MNMLPYLPPRTTYRRWMGAVAASFVALCTACSSSSGPSGSDSGTPESGGHKEASTGHDAAKEASLPFSACGHPGDMGNSLGVGKYCTGSGCPSTAPICSSIENSTMDPKRNTFFCVLPCNGCEPADYCGSGASCICQGPGMCGCTPTSCSMALVPDGGMAVCLDAGDASTD